MTKIELRTLLKLLNEAGVRFSSPDGSYSAESALKAAGRLGLELQEDDIEALHSFGEHLSGHREDFRSSFLPAVFRHPQATRRLTRLPGRVYPKPLPVPSVKIPDNKSIPPWGVLEDVLLVAIDEVPIPADWAPKDEPEPKLENWERWINTLSHAIDKYLWPRKVSSEREAEIGSLLDADFQLLQDLRDNHCLPIKCLFPTQMMHQDMFAEEDDRDIDFGTGYDRYDPTLPAHVLKQFPDMIMGGLEDKVGTLDLQLKLIFQRPRPYQTAFLQKRGEYTYCWGRTGNTPSLPSAHSLQAAIGGCTAYLALEKNVLHGNTASIEVLKQFTVDIGDRRVFAGIHYPSDNLASWYVALKLLNRVFKRPDATKAKEFLWDALNRKSLVFDAISKYPGGNASPYQPMLTELKNALKDDQ